MNKNIFYKFIYFIFFIQKINFTNFVLLVVVSILFFGENYYYTYFTFVSTVITSIIYVLFRSKSLYRRLASTIIKKKYYELLKNKSNERTVKIVQNILLKFNNEVKGRKIDWLPGGPAMKFHIRINNKMEYFNCNNRVQMRGPPNPTDSSCFGGVTSDPNRDVSYTGNGPELSTDWFNSGPSHLYGAK